MMIFTSFNQLFPQEGLDSNNNDSLDSEASRRLFGELVPSIPLFKEALEDVGTQDESVLREFMELSVKY